ncbi:MAG: hypothetical protein CM15mP102_01530 [Flavobacteriales bacterium]|nr:MAG: hypothetical protein CM15mP102_01530 [Flavobacteriales bacterium]
MPEITLSEVMEGFKTNSAITVRVEELDDKGQKIILSREDAQDKLSQQQEL